jgi:hypothetical protein
MLEIIQFSGDRIYLSSFRDTIVKTGGFLLRVFDGSQGWKGGRTTGETFEGLIQKGLLSS